MSPLGRQRSTQPSDAERQAAAVDLERIAQGGIPFGAEQRLKRIATSSTPLFTSDLSAKEYALAQADGLQPLAQVMGSSVVKHGWNTQQAGLSWGSSEVSGLSEPWNLARTRAFARLREEASDAGADGVIGIELSVQGGLDSSDTLEYVVFGTAVRDTAIPRPSRGDGLGLCTLSGQEVDKLRRVGVAVCEVVGHTSVICAQLDMSSNFMLNSNGMFGGYGAANAEVVEVTQGVYDARRVAMGSVRRQAQEAGADGIVISTLSHSIRHFEYDGGMGKVHYFYVTMHVLGTAIRTGAHRPYPAVLTGPDAVISVGDQNRLGER